MPTATPSVDALPDWSSGVLASFYRLVFAHPDATVGGLLVGHTGPAGGALVDAVIPFEGASADAAFAHAGWAYAHAIMARHYPGLEIVGWYVSRPGGGTGLSDAELAGHAHWFHRPHQVALVVDSGSRQGALYGWRDGRLTALHEGPIHRRYTHAPPARSPWRAYLLLALCGAGIGAAAHVLTTQIA